MIRGFFCSKEYLLFSEIKKLYLHDQTNYSMRPLILLTFFALMTFHSEAQFVAKVEMKDSISGICNHEEVYALFNQLDGQVEPRCSLNRAQMEVLLNNNLQFLTDNPKFKGKGAIGVYINCNGDPLQWEVSTKSKSSELDTQVLNIFKTFTVWNPGTLNNNAVDARVSFSYTIKKGKLTLY